MSILFLLLSLTSVLSFSQTQDQKNPPDNPPAAQQPETKPTEPPAAAQDEQKPQEPEAKAVDAQTVPQEATVPDQKGKNCKGKKNDVDCIGDREMEKRGLGNWYSLEKEIRIGKEYAQMVEQSVKLNTDPVINEYVNRIGQNLVKNSDAKVPFTIKVIDSDEINAFALPGGFFYVNTGLIMAADEEDELAGVMAHEIAHVAARHATRQATRGNLANIASTGLIFVGGPAGYWGRQVTRLFLPVAFLQFSKGFESEADYLGAQYMYKAGYDPQGLVTFFEKVQAKEKKKPGSMAKVFNTHPPTGDRIDKIVKEIATIFPARDQYITTTSEFDDIKARLAAMQNRRKINEDAKDNRPSLRRENTGKNKSDKDKKDEDDRPQLKRRDGEDLPNEPPKK